MSFADTAVAFKRAARKRTGEGGGHPQDDLHDKKINITPEEFKDNSKKWLLELAEGDWKNGCVPQDGTSPERRRTHNPCFACLLDDDFGEETIDAVAEWM